MNARIATRPSKPAVERFYYSSAAVLLLVLAVTGFHHFYFQGRAYPGRELTPPIRTLLITHGVAMSAWLLLSVVQPMLVAGGNRRVHMMLGRAAAALAAGLVILGVRVSIVGARIEPRDMRGGGFTPQQFMAFPIFSILMFAVFVTVAVWQRRRPHIHKPMMLLATLAVVDAAIGRIDLLNNLIAGAVSRQIFGDYSFFTVLLGGLLLAVKGVLFKSFDRWFATGVAGLAIVYLLVTQGVKTSAWEHVASFLLRW
jgi:hypothetical protein